MEFIMTLDAVPVNLFREFGSLDNLVKEQLRGVPVHVWPQSETRILSHKRKIGRAHV